MDEEEAQRRSKVARYQRAVENMTRMKIKIENPHPSSCKTCPAMEHRGMWYGWICHVQHSEHCPRGEKAWQNCPMEHLKIEFQDAKDYDLDKLLGIYERKMEKIHRIIKRKKGGENLNGTNRPA